jgi:hypothetical protein
MGYDKAYKCLNRKIVLFTKFDALYEAYASLNQDISHPLIGHECIGAFLVEGS